MRQENVIVPQLKSGKAEVLFAGHGPGHMADERSKVVESFQCSLTVSWAQVEDRVTVNHDSDVEVWRDWPVGPIEDLSRE